MRKTSGDHGTQLGFYDSITLFQPNTGSTRVGLCFSHLAGGTRRSSSISKQLCKPLRKGFPLPSPLPQDSARLTIIDRSPSPGQFLVHPLLAGFDIKERTVLHLAPLSFKTPLTAAHRQFVIKVEPMMAIMYEVREGRGH